MVAKSQGLELIGALEYLSVGFSIFDFVSEKDKGTEITVSMPSFRVIPKT